MLPDPPLGQREMLAAKLQDEGDRVREVCLCGWGRGCAWMEGGGGGRGGAHHSTAHTCVAMLRSGNKRRSSVCCV